MIGKRSTGIVTWPLTAAGLPPTRNLLNILRSLSNKTYLVTAGEGSILASECPDAVVVRYTHRIGQGAMARAVSYLFAQVSIARWIFRLRKTVDDWVFFIGGDSLILPIFTSRILRKRTIVLFAGSGSQVLQSCNDPLYIPLMVLSRMGSLVASDLILYSERFIEKYDLGQFRDKIKIESEHHLDFTSFKSERPLNTRPRKVGYIGRLSEEKGILNFLEGIKKIQRTDIDFVIYGDGALREDVESIVQELDAPIRISVNGWATREDLPSILNDLRLLVIPSYTEGLPNIMLESMACGTPVLANRVGMIEDVIINDKTGYLMEGNDADIIASGIVAALSHPQAHGVSIAAEELVHERYSFDKKLKSWEQLMRPCKGRRSHIDDGKKTNGTNPPIQVKR